MPKKDGYFKKGNPGRPKGTQNKRTKEDREIYREFVLGNMDKAQKLFDQIDDPYQKLLILEKFTGYFMGKKKDIDVTVNPYEGLTKEEIYARIADVFKKLQQRGIGGFTDIRASSFNRGEAEA